MDIFLSWKSANIKFCSLKPNSSWYIICDALNTCRATYTSLKWSLHEVLWAPSLVTLANGSTTQAKWWNKKKIRTLSENNYRNSIHFLRNIPDETSYPFILSNRKARAQVTTSMNICMSPCTQHLFLWLILYFQLRNLENISS